MSDENQGETTPEEQQASAPPADNKTNPNPPAETSSATDGSSDNGTDGEKDTDEEHQIPKHRFDEEVAKRRETEEKLKSMESRFDNMAQALSGKTEEEKDHVVDELSKKYGVDSGFISEMLGAAEKKVEAKYQKDLGSVKQAQAKQAFQGEMQKLYEDMPDAADLSKEDKAELEKMAFSQQYARTPLTDIYKILTYGRPAGKGRTAESGRPGAGRMTGEAEVDISKMSIEEFEAYSNKKAEKRS